MAMTARYPQIRINCDDVVGHALNVVAAVSRSLQKARVPLAEIEEYQNEALSGDYNKVLQASMGMVTFY